MRPIGEAVEPGTYFVVLDGGAMETDVEIVVKMTPNRFLRTPSLPVRLHRTSYMVHPQTLPSLEMSTTFLLTVPEVVCDTVFRIDVERATTLNLRLDAAFARNTPIALRRLRSAIAPMRGRVRRSHEARRAGYVLRCG